MDIHNLELSELTYDDLMMLDSDKALWSTIDCPSCKCERHLRVKHVHLLPDIPEIKTIIYYGCIVCENVWYYGVKKQEV